MGDNETAEGRSGREARGAFYEDWKPNRDCGESWR